MVVKEKKEEEVAKVVVGVVTMVLVLVAVVLVVVVEVVVEEMVVAVVVAVVVVATLACKVAAHAAQRPLLQLGLHGGGRRARHRAERVAAQVDLLLPGQVLRDVELLSGRAKRVGLVQPRCELGRVDGVAGGLGSGVEPLRGRGVLVAARVPLGDRHATWDGATRLQEHSPQVWGMVTHDPPRFRTGNTRTTKRFPSPDHRQTGFPWPLQQTTSLHRLR